MRAERSKSSAVRIAGSDSRHPSEAQEVLIKHGDIKLHNLRTAVIDPDGRVASVYDGSDWTTTEVLDELRNTLTR